MEFQTTEPCTVKLLSTYVLLLCAEQPGHHGLLSEDDDDPRPHQHEYTRMICTTVNSDERPRQSVLNATARLIAGKCDRITASIRDELQWLLIL